MSQIRIDAVQKSKSGKAWQVRSGDTWYTAYLDSGIDAFVGKVLDVEIKTFGKDGKAIDKYKVMENLSQTPQNAPRAPNEQGLAPNQAPFWLQMASNVVAHGIAAGKITSPEQVKAWVFAVKNAAEGAASGDVGF